MEENLDETLFPVKAGREPNRKLTLLFTHQRKMRIDTVAFRFNEVSNKAPKVSEM